MMADLREVIVPEHVELLAAQPNLARLFPAAALTARGRQGDLPAHALRRAGVGIDPGHVADYSRVCGFGLDGLVPITFLHVLAFPVQVALMADRAFPVPLPGLVHLSNRMTQYTPVQIGDAVDVTVWAADLAPHPKGTTVELHGRIERAGEVIWAGQSTYLRRGPGEGEAQTQDPTADGISLAGRWRIPADAGRRYARVSGDVNPIHLHALTARAMGMPTAIAHGMWTHARSVAGLGARQPTLADIEVTFRRPVRLPSTVDVRYGRDDGAQRVVVTRRGDPAAVLLTTQVRPTR